MSKNEKGYSAVQAVLLLVIVALIGFVGWYVWQAQHVVNKNLENASLNQSAIRKPKQTATQVKSTPETYEGWKSYTLTHEKLTFKFPANWMLVDESTDQKVNCTPVSECGPMDQVAVKDPLGNFIVGLQTFINIIPQFKLGETGKDCPLATNNCRQYESTAVSVANKQMFLIVRGQTTYDGSGKRYEDIQMGLAKTKECVNECTFGLSPAKNMVNSDVRAYAQYVSTYKFIPYTKLRSDPNVVTARYILQSIKY